MRIENQILFICCSRCWSPPGPCFSTSRRWRRQERCWNPPSVSHPHPQCLSRAGPLLKTCSITLLPSSPDERATIIKWVTTINDKFTWDEERKCANTTHAVSGTFRPCTNAWWKESRCLAWAALSGLNTKMTPWASLWMAAQQPSYWLEPLTSHNSTSALTFWWVSI